MSIHHRCGPHVVWYSVKEKTPPCSRKPDAPGIEVLIWPNNLSENTGMEIGATAFYGRRATGRPAFYKYGALVPWITHWAMLPLGPEGNPC